jgi:hypothetical protein
VPGAPPGCHVGPETNRQAHAALPRLEAGLDAGEVEVVSDLAAIAHVIVRSFLLRLKPGIWNEIIDPQHLRLTGKENHREGKMKCAKSINLYMSAMTAGIICSVRYI